MEGIDPTLVQNVSDNISINDTVIIQWLIDSVISREFTVDAAVADARTTGVTVGEPVILLTANDSTDHSISVTFNNGSNGGLSSSRFGSHVDGVPGNLSSEIRVTYDSDITPSFQDIVFGATVDSVNTAAVLSSMINMHGELSTEIVASDVVNFYDRVAFGYRLSYILPTSTSVTAGRWVFTNTTSNTELGARTDDSSFLTEPTVRPENTRISVIYSGQPGTDHVATFMEAFPGIGNPEEAAIDLTDVTALNRRLLLTSANFNASYSIQQVAAGTGFGPPGRGQYFVLTDGREPTDAEQAILDAQQTSVQSPDAMVVIAPSENTVVRVTANVREQLDTPVIDITVPGTTQSTLSFDLTIFQEGRLPVVAVGTRSSYSISYAGTEVIPVTELPSSATAATVGGIISTVVDGFVPVTE